MRMVDKSAKLDKFGGNSGATTSGVGVIGNTANAAGSGNVMTAGSPALGLGLGLAGLHYHHHSHHQQQQQQQQQQHTHQNGQKPVPMKLFAAWEVDRTPPNCIPRLCSLTITRLTILTPLPGDMTSLSLAVKMQSSKRTLRSHEISINGANLIHHMGTTMTIIPAAATTTSTATTMAATSSANASSMGGVGVGGSGGGGGGVGSSLLQSANTTSGSGVVGGSTGASASAGGCGGISGGSQSTAGNAIGTQGNVGVSGVPYAETDLDLNFSLQYPHFIKRDGNRLVILLQRRKKYKSRTILGYKTLAEGFVRMDAVLQKSMDMTIELTTSGKNGRPGVTVACLRAERVSSIPVDHDNKNNNSVLLADRVTEYSDEDEEVEFSSGEFNDEGNELGIPSYATKRDYQIGKHDARKYRKLQRSDIEDATLSATNPVDSDSEFEIKDKNSSRAKLSRTISLQQRNFKQKIFALLKRFKASEELEGEARRGTAALRGERDLDALFQELESLSCCEGDESGPDIDSLSIGSTPKPSLRPFFTNSRVMLHDLNVDDCNIERISMDKYDKLINNSSLQTDNNNKQKRIYLTNQINNNLATTTPADRPGDNRNDSSGNEGNTAFTDGQNSDVQNSPPRDSKDYVRLQQYYQQQQQQQQYQQGQVNNQQIGVGSGGVSANNWSNNYNEKRSRLFRTTSGINVGSAGAISNKKKQSLSLGVEPRSLLETCLSPTNVEPRKVLLDQLSRLFANDDSAIPDIVTIISPPEALSLGSTLVFRLTTVFATSFKPAFVPQNTAEIKAILQALMGKIQKYCNSNAKPPNTVQILLIGGDWLQGAVLRHYVELMGVRPPDWLNHLRFYIVPIGSSTIARYLSQMDQNYAMVFGSENWYQLCERAATAAAAAAGNLTAVNATVLGDSMAVNKSDIAELVNRIQRYLLAAGPCTQIPIAEAMVNYKEEDSCQIFVPFVSDVRIGYSDGLQNPLDPDDIVAMAANALQHTTSNTNIILQSGNATAQNSLNANSNNLTSANIGGGGGGGGGGSGYVSGSPPLSGRISPTLPTPPASASAQRERILDAFTSTTPQHATSHESVELQVDYWPIVRPNEHIPKDKNMVRSSDPGGKYSIKSNFRSLHVWRLPQNASPGELSNGLTLSFATKEKKQKQIMRLGKKKEKDRDAEKEQCVEGVARLICCPKQSHPVPLRVCIDGTEWTGVKFFQLSSQWQTHVKTFPIALIGCMPMPMPMPMPPISCPELS